MGGGTGPERARPWLAASNLVELSKPNGDVRPVAIGEVLPRILARALCISLRPAMVSYFLPCNQLGAGTRFGAEILTHSFRSALATHPDWCALQIDVANAFNSFHRHVMFDGLRESPFSGMIPFLRVFYGTPSDLYLRAGPFVQSLESAWGSRQGDPLGPFLFAFTQQQVMEPVTREFKDLLFLSYVDDTYILGPAARILEAFGVLRERLEWVGLEVQAHKCRFWEREGKEVERALPLGMQRVDEGLTMVGVPIGEEVWEVTGRRGGGRCTCPRCAAAGDEAWPGRGRDRKWAGPKWATGPQGWAGPQVATGPQVAGPQVTSGPQVAGPQV
ncbi:unnamed protein product [Closterium sp. NIES-64]|nr:unnamed protein product [Closterium sp. NIES-64]